MNRKQASAIVVGAKRNAIDSIGPRIYSRIQSRAAIGKSFLLCRSNKKSRAQLKRDGFGVIFLGLFTVVRW